MTSANGANKNQEDGLNLSSHSANSKLVKMELAAMEINPEVNKIPHANFEDRNITFSLVVKQLFSSFCRSRC